MDCHISPWLMETKHITQILFSVLCLDPLNHERYTNMGLILSLLDLVLGRAQWNPRYSVCMCISQDKTAKHVNNTYYMHMHILI